MPYCYLLSMIGRCYWTLTLPRVVGLKWSWYPHVPICVNVKLYESPLPSVEESSPGRSVCVGWGSDATRTSVPELFVQVTTVPAFTVTALGENPDEVTVIAVAVLVFAFAVAFVFLFATAFVFSAVLVFAFWFSTVAVFVALFVKSITAMFVLLFVTAVQAVRTTGKASAPMTYVMRFIGKS
jgi:hypothetical protein